MHCFSGSEGWLNYVLDRGLYIGFAGNITYKSAKDLRELAKKVPLNRLLLETDAPYLSPEGKRGTRNESTNVRITAEFVADWLKIPLVELEEKTTENVKKLFKIK
jgi:TatD DNase family protein